MALALDRRPLGKTGIEVSAMGIGSSPFRHGAAADWAGLLAEAYDCGITYYDTARSYVNGEAVIAHLPPRVRDGLTIATKTGARGGPHCLRDLQTSLRAMGRDHIDLWMTHMVETMREYELCTELGGFCDVAVAARTAGLVRATGASFHAPTEVILRAIEERAFDVVMFPFNVLGRETVFGAPISDYRDRLLPAARANGVGVVVMKVLAGGEMKHGAPRLGFLADPATGQDTLSGAIRYALMQPGIATAVLGMASRTELRRNLAAGIGVGPDPGACQRLEARVAAASPGECTRCAACLGVCPEGIEIPKVFRLLDQDRFFGMTGIARFKYARMQPDASACARCGKCAEVCPEDFDIARLLHRAHARLTQATRPAGSRQTEEENTHG
ncbi:aldo/keto reductase [Rhodovulum visakhapatnamense]|uniref:Putative aldo/keto reductase-like oxidoreductase n=1 Tax=Rhodovulum visakhapatnamense TaxID=364297 RepID=A0A4R8FLP1_9RHOB|nr:aldo/keto reductase [Rhodovulum visakhapatnamense]TDX24858.1 putative aldo/keto reductase-like oxidoreductase [Rhodovulum visakhapatnamense]